MIMYHKITQKRANAALNQLKPPILPVSHIGSLQRVVVHYPKILTVPVKSVKNVVLFLKEKCLFTTQQVTDILRDSPAVVLEDKNQLEYKFQVSKQDDLYIYTC